MIAAVSQLKCIKLEKIVVNDESISIKLRFVNKSHRITSSELANLVIQERPNILLHSCKNDGSKYFGDNICATILPHLLEHMIIDFYVEGSSRVDLAVSAISKWDFESEGKATIKLAYDNDVEALVAVKNAVELLDDLLSELSE